MNLGLKLTLLGLASSALFACAATSSPDDPSPAGEGPPAGPSDSAEAEDAAGEIGLVESEVRVCNESYARRWFLTLDGRSCEDVEGYRGAWIATPLDETDASVCTMTWVGQRYSRADMEALRAFVLQKDVMTAACGGGELDVGSLTPIPHIDNLGHIGANGCDVCGKLRRDGKIIVVLPPFLASLRQFEVPLTDGTTRAFQIHANEGARAVAVQLPPAPEGTSYAADRVTIW